MDSEYYVYGHKTPDGKVFYVGKGKGIRQYQTGNRNVYWKRIAVKYGYKSMIIENNLTEQEAYEKEIIWIKHYKETGQCDANFTEGGDGVRVEKRWWNKKISAALMGKSAPLGRDNKSFKDVLQKSELYDLYVIQKLPTTEIASRYGVSYGLVIARLREFGITVRPPGRGKVPICCVSDGKIFKSINDAANYYNLFRENIRKVLNGRYKTTGGKSFAYLPDNSRTGESPIESARGNGGG